MEQNKYESHVLQLLHNIKHKIPQPYAGSKIPVWHNGVQAATLRALTTEDLQNAPLIRLLAKWREENSDAYLSRSPITLEGTKKWLDKGVLENKDRLLFLLEDSAGSPIGHMGFYRFNFNEMRCEADNIVRGEKVLPGIMTPALVALMRWGMGVLQVQGYTLHTFADNSRAISLYERCGFSQISKAPLKKEESAGKSEWVFLPQAEKGERYWLKMQYSPQKVQK